VPLRPRKEVASLHGKAQCSLHRKEDDVNNREHLQPWRAHRLLHLAVIDIEEILHRIIDIESSDHPIGHNQ